MNETSQDIVDAVLSTDPTVPTHYLIISDVENKIIMQTTDYKDAVRMANLIRSAGGQVTLFKSLKT